MDDIAADLNAVRPVTSGGTGVSTLAAFRSAIGLDLQAQMPSGGIIMWSGSVISIPAGWRLCNGTNGAPDLQGRFVVGAGGSYSVGQTGGSENITLTPAQMPAHSHTGSTNTTGAHAHGIQHEPRGDGFGGSTAVSTTSGAQVKNTNSAGEHSHTFTTGETGTGEAHENRPPFYALCYIQKV
jgi:microcystin-dependent protein